jgi:hypothetical protein
VRRKRRVRERAAACTFSCRDSDHACVCDARRVRVFRVDDEGPPVDAAKSRLRRRRAEHAILLQIGSELRVRRGGGEKCAAEPARVLFSHIHRHRFGEKPSSEQHRNNHCEAATPKWPEVVQHRDLIGSNQQAAHKGRGTRNLAGARGLWRVEGRPRQTHERDV